MSDLSDERQLGVDQPSNPYPMPDAQQLAIMDELLGVAGDTFEVRIDATKGPFFVLFAADLISPAIIKLWADLMVHDKDCTQERRAVARRVSFAMEEWQRNRGMVP
jgi:hypothetical protein